MQKYIRNKSCLLVFIFSLLLISFANAQFAKLQLQDGVVWEGELNSRVIVTTSIKGEAEITEGELTVITKTHIRVGTELILIDTISKMESYVLNVWLLDGKLVDKNGVRLNIEKLLQEENSVCVRIHNFEKDGKSTKSKEQEQIEKKNEIDINKTIVIPLSGHVGFSYGDNSIGDNVFFNAWILEDILIKAKKDNDNVTRVILEVDSPGGYTSVRDEICDVIEKYRDDFVFIAYPHDAFSAASTIVMTCDEIYVAPDSNVGAAVVMRGGNAVEEKAASADASKVRTYYANAGRNTLIPDAFSLMEAELWYHEGENTFASIKPEVEDGWVQLDDSRSIFTFDANQLLHCKLAIEKVDSLKSFYKKDVFEDWSDEVNRRMRYIRKSAEDLSKDFFYVWELINEITKYESELYSAYRNKVDLPSDLNIRAYRHIYVKFRPVVAKAVIKSKNILKKVDKNKYHFYIPPDYLIRIEVIRDLGQHILDDGKFEYDKIFRHLDEMRDAYNSYASG